MKNELIKLLAFVTEVHKNGIYFIVPAYDPHVRFGFTWSELPDHVIKAAPVDPMPVLCYIGKEVNAELEFVEWLNE